MFKPTNDPSQLSRLVLHGYKSIAACDLNLGKLNVLIGANGAGKSNFIGFFRLINRILDQQLQLAVGVAGGSDAILYFGRKVTEELFAQLYFGNNGYRFALRPTQDNRMVFAHEALWWNVSGDYRPSSGHFESDIRKQERTPVYNHVVPAMRSWRVYHFHDTSASALVKQIHNINDQEYLREDGRNLGAFLLRLKTEYKENYTRIVKTIRLAAPFFGDFHLRPTSENKDRIQLEWTERGHDEPFTAGALSDGTLRFICLTSVLLQPDALAPASILIDEPELGLHPFAITVLASLMKSASLSHQLVASTQSVELINEFEADDLIVVDKHNDASIFTRLDAEMLEDWLSEYSLGELWKKNLLGGRPGR